MKILITGTTGYIAKRLALKLLGNNHYLVCCVRDLDSCELLSLIIFVIVRNVNFSKTIVKSMVLRDF